MANRPAYVWSGSDWDTIADPGAVRNSLVDDLGDLIVGTADNTVARLPRGGNGQSLVADSGATGGLRYVDPPTNRNLVINGAMQVAQRGTSASSITNSGYRTVDRFQFVPLGGTWTESVESDGPTGSGFTKSAKWLCTTAKASLAATDRVWLSYSLEGQDCQRIAKGTTGAQQLALSFWVKSNVTGTYVVQFEDTDNGRAVALSYSVAASDTWERKTLTFPADASGTLANDNGESLRLLFWLAAGTNFTSGTLATTWAAQTAANRAVGQTNLAAATNNYWQITGVQLETGPVATPFEFEPYEATLRKCQRYYQKSYNVDVNPGTSTDVGAIGIWTQSTQSFHYMPSVDFGVRMRATPTVTIYSTTGASGKIRNHSDSADVDALARYASMGGFTALVNNSSIAQSKEVRCNWVAEIEL